MIRKLWFVTTIVLFAASIPAPAQTYTVLHKFNLLDGQVPQGTLVLDSSGNLYGTTTWGGPGAQGENIKFGLVYKLDPAGKETVLYSFKDQTDGANPYGGLIAGPKGTLLGATYVGGDPSCPETNENVCGTVYKITLSGKLTTLHQFTGPFNSPSDGEEPYGALYRNHAGKLFGTTVYGGISCFDTDGCGVVYEIDEAGNESAIYSFLAFNDGNSDGATPFGAVAEDSKGNLYGTTTFGGSETCNSTSTYTGCGTVFELSPTSSGWKETVLYRFNGREDGLYPGQNLVIGKDGSLYGTTSLGGDMSCPIIGEYGCGTVFKLTPTSKGWKETVLYAFPGGVHGAGVSAPLMADSAGNFYGTTANGGDMKCDYASDGFPGCGVVFKLSPKGKETILHAFHGPDGFDPIGSLLLDPSTKTIYGTTGSGGDISGCSYPMYYTGCGVVFKIKQ